LSENTLKMTFDLENQGQVHKLSRSFLQKHTVVSIAKKMSHHTSLCDTPFLP